VTADAQVPAQSGVYYKRPWELTSQSLSTMRIEWADVADQWFPPVPPKTDPHKMVPPMYGYRTDELGIADVLDGVFSRLDSHVGDSMMTDWSGQQGSQEGSHHDSLQVFGI